MQYNILGNHIRASGNAPGRQLLYRVYPFSSLLEKCVGGRVRCRYVPTDIGVVLVSLALWISLTV